MDCPKCKDWMKFDERRLGKMVIHRWHCRSCDIWEQRVVEHCGKRTPYARMVTIAELQA